MELDKEMLAENLEKIPELDEEIRDRSNMLRVLLLVIAGDMRVIDRLSLSDMEELFASSTSLLETYSQTPDYHFHEVRLVNYGGCRRAV
ncbi:hypothetical protein [uncultured Acetatifactor sp.]|uniref:hypothetical protein n=1 Tax=uncultured Acetatifactor sp. TaxID=1671927 RepID=UPI0026F3F536|nr:hypothetical protein [uncultured Acetatifactor sp.]